MGAPACTTGSAAEAEAAARVASAVARGESAVVRTDCSVMRVDSFIMSVAPEASLAGSVASQAVRGASDANGVESTVGPRESMGSSQPVKSMASVASFETAATSLVDETRINVEELLLLCKCMDLCPKHIAEEVLRFIFVRSNFGLDADDDPNLLDFHEFVRPESLAASFQCGPQHQSPTP